MAGTDWVNVRLTQKGEQVAGDGVLRIVEGRFMFEISRGQTLRVTKAFDWSMVLRKVKRAGEPLFEIAGAPAMEETK